MPADIVNIADAVKTLIDDATFTAPYATPSVQRAWAPVNDVRALSDLKIIVVARGLNAENADRSRRRAVEHMIEVAFQKRMEASDTSGVDALVLLMQEVADLVFRTELAVDSRRIAPITIEHDPLYDPELLDQVNEFLGVMTIGYRWVR